MLILSYLGLVINYTGLFSGRFQHTSFTVCSKNGPALFLICTLFFALNFNRAGLKPFYCYGQSRFASNERENFLFQGPDIQNKTKGIESGSRCMNF